ncbi:hypothetical protein CMO90_01465 [Candidatus Woesearchaeota archaeon]|jgi:ribonuclease P protein subunit POP4|nr:hypothetical protein [Candidatus Woesearchaeota archaeon]|tara:strand:- start:393 stop:641 length:249 start_codon:yes stop_codon:yes gene_type:complete
MKELKQEYIGLNIDIMKSKNSSLLGLKGQILDETKNTFKIKTTKGIITIMKNISTFKINGFEVKGSKIVKRPQDRIKMRDVK